MRFLDVAKVYAQSGAGGNGCIDRVPSLAEHRNSGFGCQMLSGDDKASR